MQAPNLKFLPKNECFFINIGLSIREVFNDDHIEIDTWIRSPLILIRKRRFCAHGFDGRCAFLTGYGFVFLQYILTRYPSFILIVIKFFGTYYPNNSWFSDTLLADDLQFSRENMVLNVVESIRIHFAIVAKRRRRIKRD